MYEEDIEIIKQHFNSSNLIVLYQMYLSKVCSIEEMDIEKLKVHNSGHLGTGISMNFILSNLYYFLNKNNIVNKIVIGTGHSGVSLSSQLWLNGTWEKKNNRYSRTKEGLNNLIKDFGTIIRSEINPEYPNTIYDGGELGYALGTAYGYAIDSKDILIPCVIGDGELETGTTLSSFQLNKILKTKGKILPLINLNGLKMGSSSFMSKLSDNELNDFFSSLGYSVKIIDTHNKEIEQSIKDFQNALNNANKEQFPLIIVKSAKGYSLPDFGEIIFEGNVDVHKNPLSKYESDTKIKILKCFMEQYNETIFDEQDNILPIYDRFKILDTTNEIGLIDNSNISIDLSIQSSIKKLESYLFQLLNKNNMIIFSPDEIYSNQLEKLDFKTFEMLNENVLQSLFQGYSQSGNRGLFIGYESFMPIISSMITQYYKYLLQAQKENTTLPALTYILTSTCWENTYSHQNPGFVSTLFEKNNSNFYNILYPKNGSDLIIAVDKSITDNNCINVITTSKRHKDNSVFKTDKNLTAEIIIDNNNPYLILCATGDYMLDQIVKLYELLKEKGYDKVKVNYVTNPIILEKYSDDKFFELFNKDVPVLYLFAGYSNVIKALLFERNINCKVLGYSDGLSVFGDLENNLNKNGINMCDIIDVCEQKIESAKVLRRIKKYE